MESGAAAGPGAAASAVVPVRAFAAIVAFVADAVVLAAAFSLHPPSAAPFAGVPDPVLAGVSGALAPAACIACPAAVGISCPRSGSRCCKARGVREAEVRLDGWPWDEQGCLPSGKAGCNSLPLSPVRLRDR